MATNKATGIDNMPGELLKKGGEAMYTALTKLFQIVWNNNRIPAKWRPGVIVPLHKGGESCTEGGDYRGITLLCASYKLFTSILAERLQGCTNDSTSETQAGFRWDRRCADHIYTLYRCIKHRQHQKEQTWLAFIDFSKAFDKVWHKALWTKLRARGIQGGTYNLIRNIYSRMESRVRLDCGMTRTFVQNMGVRQGDAMSPQLFNIYIDDLDGILEVDLEGEETGIEVGNDTRLRLLKYADDIVIIAKTQDELQEQLSRLHAFCKRWRLEVNSDKTQVMAIRRRRSELACKRRQAAGEPMDELAETKLYFGETLLKHATEYKYLGVKFNAWGTWTNHEEYVLRKVNARVDAMKKWLQHATLPMQAKKSLWQQGVLPIIFYGIEVVSYSAKTWAALEKLQNESACHIMAMQKHAAVAGKLWELGWIPLKLESLGRTMTFKSRLEDMDDQRLPKLVRQHTSDRPCELEEREREALSILGEQGTVREAAIQSLFGKMSELSSLAEYYSHVSTMTPPVFGDPGAGNYSYGIVHQEGLRLRSKFRLNAHALRTGIHRHTQHREAGGVDAGQRAICPMCEAAEDTVEHFLLDCSCTADERRRMFEKMDELHERLQREREDMSAEVKEELTDKSEEVRGEIDEEHDEASRNKTAARQRTKLLLDRWFIDDYGREHLVPILLGLSCYDLDGPDGSANPTLGGVEFTAIVAEMLENAWRKRKIKLETTNTQRNQRRQRTDQRPRRRTEQRPRRRTDQRPSQDARRHSRPVSFFAHRGPSAPTPTSSGDGVNGCAAMT